MAIVTPTNIALAVHVAQNLVSEAMKHIGASSQAKRDLEKVREQLDAVMSDYETTKQDAERRETKLLQILAAGSALAFAAGLAVGYLAFRLQFIRLG